MKSGSRLEKVLEQGHFAVTAECGPPRGADPEVVRKKAALVKGFVDACNITDNQTSVVRMSSMAACTIVRDLGIEPVLQMVVRDRNRIALQSDILGASAVGIRNVLCLSGDHQSFGSDPNAKNVFDIDSIQFIDLVRMLRDDGVFPEGGKLDGTPKLLIGAAINPFADPFEIRVPRLAKKIAAGVDFIQTQCIYNLEKFEKFVDLAGQRGLLDKVALLAGITPLKSAGMAKFMRKNVAGMDIPDEVIERLSQTPKEEQAQKGIDICIETIQRVKELKGVKGVHIMAIEWEQKIEEIVKRSQLYPRPEIAE
jgi:methylenetetrahydrofolate reductase (NADH)